MVILPSGIQGEFGVSDEPGPGDVMSAQVPVSVEETTSVGWLAFACRHVFLVKATEPTMSQDQQSAPSKKSMEDQDEFVRAPDSFVA
jgi:hypothetical protein